MAGNTSLEVGDWLIGACRWVSVVYGLQKNISDFSAWCVPNVTCIKFGEQEVQSGTEKVRRNWEIKQGTTFLFKPQTMDV